VILSAQCTDAQVNRVTPALFERFPSLEDFARADIGEIEELIHSTGFFRNKAKSIQGFCRAVIKDHGGVVPQTLEELIKLPGVGRKTANVVLQELFGIATGIVVDTHVARLSKVLGLTREKDAVKIERALMELVPSNYWLNWSLYMIFLGRSHCTARVQQCDDCDLNSVCPSSKASSIKRNKLNT